MAAWSVTLTECTSTYLLTRHRRCDTMDEMFTRVMFDLSAFSHLVSRHDYPDIIRHSQDRDHIQAYATLALLEELAPLRTTDPVLFDRIREHYVNVTFPRLMRPWNELVLREVREGRPIIRDEALLPEDTYVEIIDHVAEDNISDIVANEAKRRKHEYEEEMNDAHRNMLEDPLLNDSSTSEIRHVFTEWFANSERFIQSRGERVFTRRDIQYGQLPHVRTFLLYFFARLLQATVDRRRHQEGDGYDRAYLVESVTLGHLVTDDKSLRRTARQITNSGIVVYNLKEFIATTNRH